MNQIILKNLPKYSLNLVYAGIHWSKRKKIKDTYKLMIRQQCKTLFGSRDKYKVAYEFYFRTKPLDASNTVFMLKMIEDILFEDDKYNIITELNIKSLKGKEDHVKIMVTEI